MADDDQSQRVSAEHRLVERQSRGQIAFWEQAVAFLGVAVVAATLAYLGWQIATEGDGPPVLRVQAGTSQPNGTGYLVGFEAFNDGPSTATALEIVGRLERDGTPIEESRATIDYLPPRSSRQGGLFFARDPAGFNLVLRSGGYADP
jgi:uncharacterized protein (TIGR02588 family)